MNPYTEIYSLKADRATDALIAERVMGWKPRGPHPIFGTPVYATGVGDGLLPHFSTEVYEALRLWDHLAISGWQCSLVHKPFEAMPDDQWVFHGVRLRTTVLKGRTPGPTATIDKAVSQRIESFSARGDTRAFAIARGALFAVDVLKRKRPCVHPPGYVHCSWCGFDAKTGNPGQWPPPPFERIDQ
jgi:hypothetical protein